MTNLCGVWIYPAAILELLFFTVATASILLTPHVSLLTVVKVCNLKELDAQCPDGDVIVVESAKYGRMEIGECVKVDLGYLGCKTDVQMDADRMCSGRQNCVIQIPNTVFANHSQCLPDLTSYLDISYSCQYVIPETRRCDNKNNANATVSNGYISSHMAGNESCGSESRPWVISAKSGQIINLTLVDFDVQNVYRYNYNQQGYHSTVMCKRYGRVKDLNEKQEWNICGGQRRITPVYKSIGNQVEVVFDQQEDSISPSRFLIYFERCADEIPKEGIWYKRMSHDRATMGCYDEKIEKTWNLYCQGRNWVGTKANCSAPQYGKIDTPKKRAADMKYGLAVAIIMGAIIGVIIIFVLFWIIRYRRYCRCSRPESGPNYTTNTMLLHPTRQAEEYQLRCTCPVPPPQQKVHERTMRPPRASPDTRTATLHRSPQVPRHYSLSQTVQVNGNEYEHIWQTPLPKPRSVSTDTAPSTEEDETGNSGGGVTGTKTGNESLVAIQNESIGINTGDEGYTEYKADNTENEDRDRPYYIRSKDIYNGSPKDGCRTVAGYSTLRKNNNNKNTTPLAHSPASDVITNLADV